VQQWHEDLLEDAVHVLERVLGHLHEAEDIVHGVFGDLVLHVRFRIESDLVDELQDTHCLSLLDPVSGLTLDTVENGTWTTALNNDLLDIFLIQEVVHVRLVLLDPPEVAELLILRTYSKAKGFC
jgi:hypothetical protein